MYIHYKLYKWTTIGINSAKYASIMLLAYYNLLINALILLNVVVTTFPR